jgi:hypothetical protein
MHALMQLRIRLDLLSFDVEYDHHGNSVGSSIIQQVSLERHICEVLTFVTAKQIFLEVWSWSQLPDKDDNQRDINCHVQCNSRDDGIRMDAYSACTVNSRQFSPWCYKLVAHDGCKSSNSQDFGNYPDRVLTRSTKRA